MASDVADTGPLLSLVVPVRGDASELKQLEVARATVLSGVEWIVVVDGDPGDAVSRALADLGGRSDVMLVQQERRGPGAARNVGLDLATGTVVAFLDSDDVADISRFSGLAADMTERGAQIGVLGYAMVSGDASTKIVERHLPTAGWQDPWPLLRRRAAVWRFAFDRDFLLRGSIRFPDQSYAEDLVFLILALAPGERAWGLPACGYAYRLHSDAPLTQQWAAPAEVASTLSVLSESLASCRSPEQARVLGSWQTRIWLRNRRSADSGRIRPPALTDLLKGLAWSVAWSTSSPRYLGSFVRTKAGHVGRRTR